MINYLLSGIDKELGFSEIQTKYLKEDIKNTNVITFIASTFSDIEKTNKWLNENYNYGTYSFKNEFDKLLEEYEVE